MKHKIKSTIESIKENHLIAKFSMVKDYVFAIIKIIFAIFTSSFFFAISGIYSICIGLARNVYLAEVRESNSTAVKDYQESGNGKVKEYNESGSGKAKEYRESGGGNVKEYKENGGDKAKGHNESGGNDKEYKAYLKMALLILAGSTVYVIYMARLFFISSNFNYGMIPSITIAAVSFTELVLSIKNILKAQGVLQRGLRCVCLTSSFTAIVLTQVALLSFAHVGEIETASFFNAISGCALGGLCFLTGLSMLFKYFRRKKVTDKTTE